MDVAPMADAGITAYRVARRAALLLKPGSYCVILGVGGLGHIALQCLHELCATRTIAVDSSQVALSWPLNWELTTPCRVVTMQSRRSGSSAAVERTS